MKRVGGITNQIFKWSGVLGVVALLGMCALTFADVCLRFFLNRPIIGSVEVTGVFLTCMVFFGIGRVTLTRGHITVDIIESLISGRAVYFLNSINNYIVMGLSLLFMRQSILQGLFLQNLNIKTTMLKIPLYPFYYITALGFFLLLIAVVVLQFSKNKREIFFKK